MADWRNEGVCETNAGVGKTLIARVISNFIKVTNDMHVH